MNKLETRDHTDSESLQEWPKQCGTESTPPCPLAAVHQERNALIYLLAGNNPCREDIEKIAVHVDEYLVSALRGVRVLTRTTASPHRPVLG